MSENGETKNETPTAVLISHSIEASIEMRLLFCVTLILIHESLVLLLAVRVLF